MIANLKQISMLQIDYFLSVARHLNFTEAAKSLYITQPTISKQIAILEKEIGVQLFFRTKRTVRLTPAGTVLLKELQGINQRIESAVEIARQSYLGEHSSIKIGCLEAMDTGLFVRKYINNFKAKYPGVHIVLERHSFKALREKLIYGSLDLIFTLSFEIDDSLGVLGESVATTTSSIIMQASHPLAQHANVTLGDLKNENFVLISRDESPRGFDSVIGLCRKHGFTPNVVRQLPNVESLLLCVESGLGVSVFDSTIRLYTPESFKLFTVEDDFMDVVVAWKEENSNPALSLFTNQIINTQPYENCRQRKVR